MPLTQMHQPTQRNLPPLPVPDFLDESVDETIPKNNEILSSDDGKFLFLDNFEIGRPINHPILLFRRARKISGRRNFGS